jgi:hypothetical protein
MEKLISNCSASVRRIWKRIFQRKVFIYVTCILTLLSCDKETIDSESNASIKLVSTISEPKMVKMISSTYGNLLAFFASEEQGDSAFRQELFLLNQSGEVLKNVFISDSTYQYMNAVAALNGGFIVCASNDGSSYFSIFHIGDNGDVISTKNVSVSVGSIINEPSITTNDNNYMVVYQSFSWGYYMWKGDANGSDIFNKRIPIPNARHYGSGLNYGEKYSRFMQANDSLIIIQGITYDEYDRMIENCFLRAVDESVNKKWYSGNYDSTHIESSSGLFYSADNKIVLFGTKSTEILMAGYGDAFARIYSLTGILENEIVYPRIGETPNTIKQTIQSPDGGYFMIGSNNQLPSNIVVSPNQLVLIKLNADLTLNWSKSIDSYTPSKGFDAVYLSDGSIGVISLLKENNSMNKLIYMHLDETGNIINN